MSGHKGGEADCGEGREDWDRLLVTPRARDEQAAGEEVGAGGSADAWSKSAPPTARPPDREPLRPGQS